MLDLVGLSQFYGGVHALDKVRLHISAGQRHAVCGPNGAGKTTLLRLIAGYTTPSAGSILLDDTDITGLPAYARARLGIRATHQQPQLLDQHPAADNMMLALASHHGLTRRVLPLRNRHRHLADLTRDLLDEHRLTHLADRPAGELTHGQRRRLELALALIPGCRLLLLDEPTAGLDPADREHTMSVLINLPRSVTVVFVDHDPMVVDALADTATDLDAGHPVATRTIDQAGRR